MAPQDTKVQNPPAFPTDPINHAAGLTLRDYFAAAAFADVAGRFSWTDEQIQQAAQMAYQLADAMLRERAK